MTAIVTPDPRIDVDPDGRRDVSAIVLHHFGQLPKGMKWHQVDMDFIRRLHTAPPPAGRGWNGPGYQKAILARPGFPVQQGRPDVTPGAHAFGFNEDTIGILCVGDFRRVDPPRGMIDQLVQVVAITCVRYQITPSRQTIKGHGELMATECPGRLLNFIPEVIDRVLAYPEVPGHEPQLVH